MTGTASRLPHSRLPCADHFPDAYSGQNTWSRHLNPALAHRPPPTALAQCSLPFPPLPHFRKIRDTLNNLILKSPQNWQTSVGLPFFQIEGTVVEWDE